MRHERDTAITDVEHARRLGWLCYALQAAGCVLYIVALWGQVFTDTRKAATVAPDGFFESHRHWRLRTTLLFLVWTILGGLTIPLGIGWLFAAAAVIWYVARVAAGMVWYARGRPIGVVGRLVRDRNGAERRLSPVFEQARQGCRGGAGQSAVENNTM